ncbi:hypothetical protein FBU30_011053 [Linnemannia zychae]|nr:hypothetical protein FBU30_011053 [Linnemannia zychae]
MSIFALIWMAISMQDVLAQNPPAPYGVSSTCLNCFTNAAFAAFPLYCDIITVTTRNSPLLMTPKEKTCHCLLINTPAFMKDCFTRNLCTETEVLSVQKTLANMRLSVCSAPAIAPLPPPQPIRPIPPVVPVGPRQSGPSTSAPNAPVLSPSIVNPTTNSSTTGNIGSAMTDLHSKRVASIAFVVLVISAVLLF